MNESRQIFGRMNDRGQFLGKYRGVVLSNDDPLKEGRLQLQVPDVTGLNPSTWAMPCVPLAGMNMGFFAMPVVGSGVWVEYEQGDPEYPIWVGCFWGSEAEVPRLAIVPPAVPGITLQTPLGHGIVISDVPGDTGGIQIQTATGATISVTDAGIMISSGKGAVIEVTETTVKINGDALTVT